MLLLLLTAESSKDEDAPPPPLARFRRGYLWVSDMSRQAWCEQQVHYGFARPHLLPEQDAPEVAKGSEMHLARELETQDYVDVEVSGDEDIFGVKLLNLALSARGLTAGAGKVREVPVFGLAAGAFFLGKIDELRLEDDGELVVSEFKTRKSKRLPGKAQTITHNIQVSTNNKTL